MTVTDKAWQSYIKKLSAINRKAAKIMQDWISVNGLDYPEELISYAYGIVGKYGEAAGSLACEMYDTLARAQGKTLPDAVPAEPATYSEVARAVIGTKKVRPGQVPDTVARLVKQTAADTTLQNAKRDGAQFAWIPHGDTCSFCITLASRGWQYMSKNALKNGHAEHIHANCDCEYGVRFDGKSNIAGYDPDKYLEQYNNAEGTKPRDKINSMRREQYAKDADKINARRRELYAERQRKVNEANQGNAVDIKAISSEDYRRKFRGITGSSKVDDAVCHQARQILKHRSGSSFEDLALLDADTGSVIHLLNTSDTENGVSYDDAVVNAIDNAHKRGRRIVAVHNHPGNLPPSLDDGVSLLVHGYDIGIVVAHDGSVYKFTKTDIAFSEEQCRQVHNNIAYQIETGGHIEDVWYNMLKEFGMIIERR